MWAFVKVWQNGTHRHHGEHPPHSRHHGFSHPARFEALEERIALSAAPGTSESGNVSPDASLIVQNGLFALPGAAAPSNSTNPADIALVNVTGSAVPTDDSYAANDALAFNQPSWIPNDRPPFPGENLPPNNGPMNMYQAANTAYGIRNFEIGANTSLVHRSSVGMGISTPTARRATDVKTAVTDDMTPSALGEDLLADVALRQSGEELSMNGGPSTANARLASQHHQAEDTPLPPSDATAAHRQQEDAEEPSPTLLAAVDHEPSELLPQLDGVAVDRLMANQVDAETATADLAVSQVVAEEAPEERSATGSAVHALAASIAVAATVAAEQSRAVAQPVAWGERN